MENQKNFNVSDIGPMENVTRVVLKETLSLTGAEISANRIPAGKESPFAHSHKRNEEIYLFTSGKGCFWLDGTIVPVKEGTTVRVSPDCVRSLKADDSEPLSYFCIQVDSGSLIQSTREDGIISKLLPRW